MKVYNKFVESKKEPFNKSDIWFDGKNINVYKEGKWESIPTAVEGDKIKEGSIPLSALRSGNNLLAGLAGDDSTSQAITEDNFNYPPRTSEKTVYIYITARNKMVELSKYSTISIVDGPPAEIIWDDDGIRITRFASYYAPIIYFKLKAPIPDWSAQPGEPGYIENKPDIDPVVWKYMLNPIVITSLDDRLPTDILKDDGTGIAMILPKYAGLIRGGYDSRKQQYVNACAVKSEENGFYYTVYIGGDLNITAYIEFDGSLYYDDI